MAELIGEKLVLSDQDERVRNAFAVIENRRTDRMRAGGGGFRIGLVGRGIGSSLTPIMHELEGRRLGLAYSYDLVDFDRLGLLDADLGAVFEEAGARCYDGLNVTYPFKQAIIPLLDGLSPEAAAIGAVNTVVLRDSRAGHNTDCWGFAESLRRGLPDVTCRRVLQFGAGGAGAAVAHAMMQLGATDISIVDAELERGRALAAKLAMSGVSSRALSMADAAEVVGAADGVVNATPVGMEKLPGMPFDPHLLRPGQWVADVVYFPRETQLLREARMRGCRVLPGGGMAIFQAVRAFELFTDIAPDARAMEETFAVYA